MMDRARKSGWRPQLAESAGGENPVAVDVVVPLFRPGKWLERCLASLVSSQGARLYPILVDDCPEDPRAAAAAAGIPGALGLTTERNLGFAAAVNRGIAAGSSQYVLCLNQDTELRGDFIARLARRLADDDG